MCNTSVLVLLGHVCDVGQELCIFLLTSVSLAIMLPFWSKNNESKTSSTDEVLA